MIFRPFFRSPPVKALFIGLFFGISLLTPEPASRAAGPAIPFQSIILVEYASGIPELTDMSFTGVPGDNRLFVTARNGWVYLVDAQGETSPEVVLDIDDRIIKQWYEQGLLGIVFDPGFATNGYLYLNYTYYAPLDDPRRGDTHISRFQMDPANPGHIDPDSEEVLLTIDQPAKNHNGGDMTFGPDGYLYIASGDGEGGAPLNAQNKDQLLGKILRLDPGQGPGSPPDCIGDGSGSYTVPASNPFADGPGGDCDEIWAYGLRNPWRISFDSLTGDFYIGDVGEDSWEEINHQPAASPGGENYGWPCYEGSHVYNPICTLPSFGLPVYEYPHTTFSAVVGGFVYRGAAFAGLQGSYLLADYDGRIQSLTSDGASWQAVNQGNFQAAFSSFGEDVDGELYLADYLGGVIYRVVYAPVKAFLPVVAGSPGAVNTPEPVPRWAAGPFD